jgi:hypothetical protein
MNRRCFAVGAALLVLAMLGSAAAVRAECLPLKGEETPVFTGESFKQYGIWAGEGTSTVLGAYTVEYLVHGQGNGSFIALGTIEAANGDLLFTIAEGELVAEGEWEGTTIIVGGTGRFEGATGGAEFTTTFVEPGVVHTTFDGEICLP